MKKKVLILLGILVLATTSMVSAKSASNPELAAAIKQYKTGNYTECYSNLQTFIKKNPSNALGYYYMAMTSAQVGRKSEAINNYAKAMALSAPNTNIYAYAKKGKLCLESPSKCQAAVFSSELEEFVNSRKGLSKKVESEFERLKLENMMREMNNAETIDTNKFREYKDFSSYNIEGTPSNDEIVAAIKTLQRAGLYSIGNNGFSNEMSMITGLQGNNQMFNMLGNSNLSPQVIQAMLTNNMSLGF